MSDDLSKVSSLVERRWNNSDDTRAHTVTDMLRVAIAQIERGDMNPAHAILCMGHVSDDNAITTDWLQTGQFNGFEQLGLLERIKVSILDTAERA